MEESKSGVTEDNESKYSIINISGKYFGIDVSIVSEVVPIPEFTKLPNVNPGIKGIFSLRGKIYSIIDPRVLLDLDLGDDKKDHYAIIVNSKNYTFALLANEILDLVEIPAKSIIKNMTENEMKYVNFISGSTEHKKLGMIELLDIEAIINSEIISKFRFNGI